LPLDTPTYVAQLGGLGTMAIGLCYFVFGVHGVMGSLRFCLPIKPG
jgi:hypothetical protein